MGQDNKKYNTGKPIEIEDINPEEIDLAIHEWAEGSENLEKVLKEGYKNGLYSTACCVGGGEKHCSLPYIMYDLKDEKSRKIALYLTQKLEESDVDCKIVFYDDSIYNEINPEEYPTINLTQLHIEILVEDKEETFRKMFEILSEIEKVDLDKIEIPKDGAKTTDRKFKFEDLVKKALKEYPEMLMNDDSTKIDGVFIKDKSDLEDVEWNLEEWQ